MHASALLAHGGGELARKQHQGVTPPRRMPWYEGAMARVQPQPNARLGQRVAEGAFLLLAAWFAVSSTWQITKSALIDPPPTSTSDGPATDAPAPPQTSTP